MVQHVEQIEVASASFHSSHLQLESKSTHFPPSLLQQLAQLELVCQQFYESMDLVVRSEAEKALVTFSESPESLPQCQFILERSQV